MYRDFFGKFFPFNSAARFINNSKKLFIQVIGARYQALMDYNLPCLGNCLDDRSCSVAICLDKASST